VVRIEVAISPRPCLAGLRCGARLARRASPPRRPTTKGRQGRTDRISLWQEIIGMIQDKGLAVSKCRTRSPRCVRNLELL
jgi:hypothetical protein